MSMFFSEADIAEVKEMAIDAYASAIAGVELTYGKDLEIILLDENYRSSIANDIIIDYIEQLRLEKQFFWTCGVDDVPIINKLIAFLESIIEERMNYK